MSNFEPIQKAPERKGRWHNWEQFTNGEWWQLRDSPEKTWSEDHAENNRLRCAAAAWGRRRGLAVETRTARRGKEFYLRFKKVSES